MTPYYHDERSNISIFCGDSVEVLKTISSGSIDVVWTDPPYGHDNHNGDLNARLNDHRNIESQPIKNDSSELMRSVVDSVLKECVRVLKTDCCCCCCCCGGGGGGPKPTFAWVAQRMDSEGLQFFHSVIWDKLNPGLGWRYRRQHEMVMVAHKAGGKLAWANDDLAVPNVIEMMPSRTRLHPNEKPLALVTAFLGWHCKPGSKVVDPFLGSGTTLRAAKDLGLPAIGIDIEERWCEVAAKRLDQESMVFRHQADRVIKQEEMMLGL